MACCPICRTDGATDQRVPLDGHDVNCPACGQFMTNDGTLSLVRAREKLAPYVRSLMMHSIRQMQGAEGLPFIDANIVREITSRKPPSLREQTDRLIIFLGDRLRLSDPAEFTKIEPWDFAALQATIGVYSESTFWAIVQRLGQQHLLDFQKETRQFRFTLDLWDQYEVLKNSQSESRLAFMAMEFGKSDIYSMYQNCFKQAVAEAGFELKTLLEGQKAGIIDDQLRVEIRRARFLIADLTHGNKGSYWEAGFAEGLGNPVIYTCETNVFHDEHTKPHFDANHCLTIVWDKAKPEEAAAKLKATIRATLPGEAKLADD